MVFEHLQIRDNVPPFVNIETTPADFQKSVGVISLFYADQFCLWVGDFSDKNITLFRVGSLTVL